MSETVDALFGGEKPGPRGESLGRLRVLLGVAGVLDVFGVFCFLSVPGALLTLWVWHRADEELTRAQTDGDGESARSARRLKNVAFGLIGWAMLAMFVQTIVIGILLGQDPTG